MGPFLLVQWNAYSGNPSSSHSLKSHVMRQPFPQGDSQRGFFSKIHQISPVRGGFTPTYDVTPEACVCCVLNQSALWW